MNPVGQQVLRFGISSEAERHVGSATRYGWMASLGPALGLDAVPNSRLRAGPILRGAMKRLCYIRETDARSCEIRVLSPVRRRVVAPNRCRRVAISLGSSVGVSRHNLATAGAREGRSLS